MHCLRLKTIILNVVASDGHRLAVVKEEINDNVENNKLVVPGMTLRELLKFLKMMKKMLIL